MNQMYYDMVESNPVIAAVKDMEGLKRCCKQEDLKVVFILFGDLCNIGSIVDYIKKHEKLAIVHLDLITGLGSKDVAVEFIHKFTKADGVISTKASLIKKAKELGMMTVLRFFLLDSLSIDNLERQLSSLTTDFIEILPGVMPKVTRRICQKAKVPVITGGLISDKEDVMGALTAGATAVSTSSPEVWEM